MLTAFLAFALFAADMPACGVQAHHAHAASADIVLANDAAPAKALRDALTAPLMNKIHSMNDAGEGIFQVDVTSIVAPYFPAGQTFAETQKVLKEQDLGSLRKFQGMQDHPGTTMYVARFNLMYGAFTQVYVVLNFDFAGGSENNMVLTKAGGLLRAGGM
ncbi:hypothetical protein [Methyloferula stellata]|uniref:hypothetical protein n=1 Tax=Methyloferula stellata TaxID=876270 RepID=UPI0003787074|nr:hypothetical protein [Methyloferula stellata]